MLPLRVFCSDKTKGKFNGVIFIHTCQGLTMKNTIILCYVADLGLEKPITSVA